MSTKKERKEEVTTTENSSSSATTSSSSELQQEQRRAASKTLEITKDNIRRSTEEARSQIPRYTQAVNEYQEQTIQAAREIADNYIESQREIINSLQSAWMPHIEKANKIFTSNWMSPRYLMERYANMVSRSADNMIASTRLVNNMMFANMNVFKTWMLQAKDNARELSRIGVNSARTFEQTSRDTATATTRIGGGGYGDDNTSTTSRVYVEREQ